MLRLWATGVRRVRASSRTRLPGSSVGGRRTSHPERCYRPRMFRVFIWFPDGQHASYWTTPSRNRKRRCEPREI